jgi:hypothetical protein
VELDSVRKVFSIWMHFIIIEINYSIINLLNKIPFSLCEKKEV